VFSLCVFARRSVGCFIHQSDGKTQEKCNYCSICTGIPLYHYAAATAAIRQQAYRQKVTNCPPGKWKCGIDIKNFLSNQPAASFESRLNSIHQTKRQPVKKPALRHGNRCRYFNDLNN
jgi:hypothetical protein